jgi:AraC-like DNA-binding protein
MNQLKNIKIEWSSPNVLEQIVQNIKNPLESIIATTHNDTIYSKDKIDKIIFSSSQEIKDIIDELMLKSKSKSMSLSFQDSPDFFEIYETNENVRSMCSENVAPQKMTKIDKDWLTNLEIEVYSSIKQNYLNLNEISYKMAVSERQLHRKIANLVYLTPNKFIRILRLHKAKKMIDNYIERSISQIAYAVGYNDVHYFSRLFIEQYNVSPKDLIGNLR